MASALHAIDAHCKSVTAMGFKPDAVVKVERSTFRAHSDLLRMFSTCANGISELTEWDLSALTIFDGKPPSAKVIAAWLEALYWYPESPNTPKTLQDAIPVLLFADAVGSPQRMMHTIATDVEEEWSLRVPKSTIDGPFITLPLVGTSVYLLHTEAGTHIPGNRWYKLCKVDADMYSKSGNTLSALKAGTDYHVLSSSSQERYLSLINQLAEQLEELLYLANKLHIRKLALALQAFLRLQRAKGGKDSIFGGDVVDRVVTKRVQNVLDRETSGIAWLKWVTGDDTRQQ
jgi:hypothetical protein